MNGSERGGLSAGPGVSLGHGQGVTGQPRTLRGGIARHSFVRPSFVRFARHGAAIVRHG